MYGLDWYQFGGFRITDVAGVLTTKPNAIRGGTNLIVEDNYIVRRLTPTEAERLQGYPDGWTDIGEWVDTKGKKHNPADSPRYKALGNSIALPFWYYLCKKISYQYGDEKPTMASLFDGIGGFPLIWESINGKGTCLWASEIDEFCIAVTKKHFPGSEGEDSDTDNENL